MDIKHVGQPLLEGVSLSLKIKSSAWFIFCKTLRYFLLIDAAAGRTFFFPHKCMSLGSRDWSEICGHVYGEK